VTPETLRILILCTGNSARSQMAEGLLRRLVGDHETPIMEVVSAGTVPSEVHPLAIRAMEERGIDISAQSSKDVDSFLDTPFDYVITVCDSAAEACPVFPGPARRLHWSFPDPAAVEGKEELQLQMFRQVREGLEGRLQDWLSTLG
jgi:arsenate reductase